MPQYVVVLSNELDASIEPTSSCMDVRGIAEHLTTGMEKGETLVPVFIGCGCAKHEVAVCKEIANLGFSLQHEMFMDRSITSAAISHIQSYADALHKESDARPIIVFSFAALQAEMQRIMSITPTTKFIVQGIHASQTFRTRQALYDFHFFLSYCARLAAVGVMQQEYYNFMDETSCASMHEFNDEIQAVVTNVMPCRPGSNTWVYHTRWWDHACRVITSTAAARLLLEAA